jgi:hypothetical protein
MSFSVSPIDALFPVPIVPETQSTADRQHANDEANRRRHAHLQAETPPATAPADPLADPESPPTAGTLLDVLV